MEVCAFQADALDGQTLCRGLAGTPVDVVLTDVPYGRGSQWQGVGGGSGPAWAMLDSLLHILDATSVVAIISDKAQDVAHEGYRRVGRFQIGLRKVVMLRPGR